MENTKKDQMTALNKDCYSVIDGKVVIESEELANALNEGLELFCDDETASAWAKGISCCNASELENGL